VTFHYIVPQLTMGLALLIVILKTMTLRTGEERYSQCARFWATSGPNYLPAPRPPTSRLYFLSL
jgi:hypothetical protein